MSMITRVDMLRKRHAEIDMMVHSEEARPLPDISKLYQFKREKLRLKDEMTRLANLLPSEDQRQSA